MMKSASTWSLHLIAGLLLIVLLGIHMITMHLDLILGWFNIQKDLPGTNWENVVARGRHITMAFFYILFLGAALYHGLYGVRTIIFEMGISPQTEKTVTLVFVVAGVGLFIFGTAAAITFFSTASAGVHPNSPIGM